MKFYQILGVPKNVLLPPPQISTCPKNNLIFGKSTTSQSNFEYIFVGQAFFWDTRYQQSLKENVSDVPSYNRDCLVSVCLSIHPFVRLYIRLSIFPSVCPFISLSLRLSVRLSVWLSRRCYRSSQMICNQKKINKTIEKDN